MLTSLKKQEKQTTWLFVPVSHSNCDATIPQNSTNANFACFVTFRWNRAKLSLAQRKDRVAQKKASFLRAQEQEVSD